MSNKVYIGKLAEETSEKDIEAFFTPVGEVVSIEISKKLSFKPNAGYAYIVMKADSDAPKAVKDLNDKNLLGSRVIVTQAHMIDQKGHSYYSKRRRRR